jgi:hypothetical protein
MPPGTRETMQLIPITLQHVQSRGGALHAPGDQFERGIMTDANDTPIFPT